MPYVFPQDGYGPASIVYKDSSLSDDQKIVGIYVETVPEPQEIAGKYAVLYGDKATNSLWYEYFKIIPEPIDVVRKASEIALRSMIIADELTREELDIIYSIYPAFQIGKDYLVGDLFTYNDKLFEVIQAHTSQADWKPDEVPALYRNKMPDNVIPEWTQPQGAHDAYKTGDIVTHNGQLWISTIDSNVWEPGVYGWQIYALP